MRRRSAARRASSAPWRAGPGGVRGHFGAHRVTWKGAGSAPVACARRYCDLPQIARPAVQRRLQRRQRRARPLGHDVDRPVVAVPDRAAQAQAPRLIAHKRAEADPLHMAAHAGLQALRGLVCCCLVVTYHNKLVSLPPRAMPDHAQDNRTIVPLRPISRQPRCPASIGRLPARNDGPGHRSTTLRCAYGRNKINKPCPLACPAPSIALRCTAPAMAIMSGPGAASRPVYAKPP